ncbi:MAG: ORF6N domain-containing protein [Pyrinomonadaceae bacterium]
MATKKQTTKAQTSLVPVEIIERHVYLLRRQKVMLDNDLADIYRVETKVLNQAVKRNIARFPEDFMFQLTSDEAEFLRSQFVTSNDPSTFQSGISKTKRGGRQYLPYVFTEQGVAMLSSVLRSERAVQANIAIMRAFVQLRRMLLSNEELNRKLLEFEKKYDTNFKIVFDALRQLMIPPVAPRRHIGFKTSDKR